jgi:hypothetical protein
MGAEDDFTITVRGASISSSLEAMATAYFDSLARRMDAAPVGT